MVQRFSVAASPEVWPAGPANSGCNDGMVDGGDHSEAGTKDAVDFAQAGDGIGQK